MAIAKLLVMDCYFGTSYLPENHPDGKSSVVMFYIPDLGIRFKAPFAGVDRDHSDLASLLALLEFIDSNQKYFSSNTFQMFGDNLRIINQINGRAQIRNEFSPLFEKAKKFREQYRFSVDWVPSDENSATDSLLH